MSKQYLNGVPYGVSMPYRELTQAEYDALPDSKNNDGIMYFIKNAGVAGGIKMFALADIYDTNEREIGVWIDGKPIYEKVFTGLSVATQFDTWVNTGISIPDGDKVISARLGQTNISFIDIVLAKIESGTLRVWFANRSSYTYNNFIVQYTKTTDVPGSGSLTPQGTPTHHYSTDEHVVGTWIDGKPVYEKTYALNLFQINQDWTTSGINEPIDKVIKADLIDEYNQHFTCEVGLSATSPSGYYSIELATRYPSSSNRRFNYLIMEYTKTTD